MSKIHAIKAPPVKKCGSAITCIMLLALSISVSCSRTAESEAPPSQQVLDKYLEFSPYTDPGEFVDLYQGLPESMEALCDLIKKQLIHPFELKKFGDKIPRDRVSEDQSLPSVAQMLKELLARDQRGLVASRPPENRLVVACVHHSLLLASILRHQGIPVRLRAGNAKYIGDDRRIRVTHVICEVWDRHREKWFLVDPDRQKIDFDRQEFEFASETWQRLRNNAIEKKYYISRYSSVDQAAAHLLYLDLSYVTGKEEPYWNDPPIVLKIRQGLNDISKTELQRLDQIAALLKDPDRHLEELIQIQNRDSGLNDDEKM